MDNPKNRIKLVAATIGGFLVLGTLIFLGLSRQNTNKSKTAILDKQQSLFVQSKVTDPILRYLPYEGVGYRINGEYRAIGDTSTLVINVTIVLSGSDYNADGSANQKAVDQYKADALAYIKTSGFDPAKYTIEYTGY